MNSTEIIETLRHKLSISSGRHLYGILGTYPQLVAFAETLRQASTPEGKRFSRPISVNQGILEAIPDDEFKRLVQDEPKRPEPTTAHIRGAFEVFLRRQLQKKQPVVLSDFELVFSYHLDLSLLRTLAADDSPVILLLPGNRHGDRVVLFPECGDGTYVLPVGLIAENHLWMLDHS